MKKVIKAIMPYLCILLILVFSFLGVWLYEIYLIAHTISDELPKEKVFSLVLKKKEYLLQNISNENFEKCEKIRGIKKVTVYDDCIDFDCGGTGISRYSGFYYIDTLDLQEVFDIFYNHYAGVGNQFVSEGEGYISKVKDQDNSIYIEQITENFYYYNVLY
jgi:predicted membrane protein